MKKINKDYVLGAAGIILILLSLLWWENGGSKKSINHDLQQIEEIIESS